MRSSVRSSAHGSTLPFAHLLRQVDSQLFEVGVGGLQVSLARVQLALELAVLRH
jgi:hypothetical protein